MEQRRINRVLHLACGLAALGAPAAAFASEIHGQVIFSGQPVPGATVTMMRGAHIRHRHRPERLIQLCHLPDGTWQIKIEMLCFAPVESQVMVSPNTPAGKWELTLLPVDQIMAQTKRSPQLPPQPAPELTARAGQPAKPARAKVMLRFQDRPRTRTSRTAFW